MSKFLFLLAFLFIGFTISAQRVQTIVNNNSSFTLQAKFEKLNSRDEEKEGFLIRQYNIQNDLDKENTSLLPRSQMIIAIPPNSNPTVNLHNVKTVKYQKTIPEIYYNAVKGGNKHLRKNSDFTYFENKGKFWFRNFYCMVISVNRVIFDEDQNELVEVDELELKINFDPTYNIIPNTQIKTQKANDDLINNVIANFSIAEQFGGKQEFNMELSNDEWINYGNDYLKLGVLKDGIYRVSYDDLQTQGINPQIIDIDKIKLLRNEEQISIYLSGTEDGVFGENDYIEFWGTRNYSNSDYREINSENEPYNEFLDRYSNESIYWLTWTGNDGIRTKTVNIYAENLSDTLFDYLDVRHYESNNGLDYVSDNLVSDQLPDWQSRETWFNGRFDPGTITKNFNADNIVPNTMVDVYLKIFGFASNIYQNAHSVSLSLNGSSEMYDSSMINKFQQKILHANFDSEKLIEGLNTISITSNQTDAFPNSIAFDWFDVEYRRSLSLVDDSLNMYFNGYNLDKEFIVKVSNASAQQYVVYKIGEESRKIDTLILVNNHLYFSDFISENDQYFIIAEEKINKPKFHYVKNFSNILTNIPESEYLLITNDPFLDIAEDYAEFISNNYDVTPSVVNVNDIYDQFNYGSFSPEPIKTFLMSAYNEWTNNKPEYIFLVGEANYDYKNNSKIENPKPNIVPSYGHPVSDNWFVIWDEITFIPQMNIGRLACTTIEEFQHYFTKHIDYINSDYSIWNKSFMLFSGGLDESSRQFSKRVNDELENEVMSLMPVGGYTWHFYSTSQPPSNFGPFTNSFVDSTISAGAVAISYIGHSGTKIWDNGIEEVDQLENSQNKSLFITDFGCSTGKFAEPDITAFGEAFTNMLEGDAIGYIGNTTLGFTSIASTFPRIFYKELLSNVNSMASNFTTAKIKYLNIYGMSDVNKILIYSSTLFADPIVRLQIPPKPNLMIEVKDVFLPEFLDDNLDSIEIEIKFKNLGSVDSSVYSISVKDYHGEKLNYTRSFVKALPLNNDNLKVNIPIRNLSGLHRLEIELDALQEIDEIYEDDNKVNFNYNVFTSSIRLVGISNLENRASNKLTFLNSVKQAATKSFLIELDTNDQFENVNSTVNEFDTLVSELNLEQLIPNQRYWIRTKLLNGGTYFNASSFIYSDTENSYYYLADSISFAEVNLNNLKNTNSEIILEDKEIALLLRSAGYISGGTAKVQLGGVDYANNARGCGHQIIVFDQNYKYIESQWFNRWADPDFVNYINFLDTLSSDKYLAVALSNFCGGAGVNQSLIDKLREYGSILIDSVTSNSSWVFVGRKGFPSSLAKEEFSTSREVAIDTTFITSNDEGYFITDRFLGGTEFNKITVKGNLNDSTINILPIIYNNGVDTLSRINFTEGVANLTELNDSIEDEKQLIIRIRKTDEYPNPSLSEFNIDIKLNPELAINYQVVSVAEDTVNQGETANLAFYVYNVGESRADSFNVKVDLVRPDNFKETIFNGIVDSLGAEKRRKFEVEYNTTSFNGARTFEISIDPENKIMELYEDNNFFNIPFYVVGDTTKPDLHLTIDGGDIFDGEYISSNPEIQIQLSDPSLIPIIDTSSIVMFLNNRYVNYKGNENFVNINFSESNPKVTVNYTPTLEDGEYTFRVFGKDASGNMSDSAGITKHFVVENDAKIMNVYNYPNPFSEETYFTFKLTQIPDEVKIKIFTIAGRLINEIILNPAQLKYDLNKVYWNSRDNDGDLIGNGVYLYKIIMSADGKKQDITQKLAVVR